MRLIELITSEVSKVRVCPHAELFVQDPADGRIRYLESKESPVLNDVGEWVNDAGDKQFGRSFGNYEIASDAAETVLTREELLNAYTLVGQGYTLCSGSGCPVRAGNLVDVIVRRSGNFEALTVWIKGKGRSIFEIDEVVAYRLSTKGYSE